MQLTADNRSRINIEKQKKMEKNKAKRENIKSSSYVDVVRFASMCSFVCIRLRKLKCLCVCVWEIDNEKQSDLIPCSNSFFEHIALYSAQKQKDKRHCICVIILQIGCACGCLANGGACVYVHTIKARLHCEEDDKRAPTTNQQTLNNSIQRAKKGTAHQASVKHHGGIRSRKCKTNTINKTKTKKEIVNAISFSHLCLACSGVSFIWRMHVRSHKYISTHTYAS